MIIKHLAGQHNQRSHAGKNVHEHLTEIINAIPVSPLMGDLSHITPPDNVDDASTIWFPQENNVVRVYSDSVHLALNDNRLSNDAFEAFTDYGVALAKALGINRVQIRVTSPTHLPGLINKGYVFRPTDLARVEERADLRTARQITFDEDFTQELINAFRARGKVLTPVSALHLTRQYRASYDKMVLNDVRSRFDQLDLYGLRRVQKLLERNYGLSATKQVK